MRRLLEQSPTDTSLNMIMLLLKPWLPSKMECTIKLFLHIIFYGVFSTLNIATCDTNGNAAACCSFTT